MRIATRHVPLLAALMLADAFPAGAVDRIKGAMPDAPLPPRQQEPRDMSAHRIPKAEEKRARKAARRRLQQGGRL